MEEKLILEERARVILKREDLIKAARKTLEENLDQLSSRVDRVESVCIDLTESEITRTELEDKKDYIEIHFVKRL